jgi:myxalamid-type polyketide synthase MxaE and MxaD
MSHTPDQPVPTAAAIQEWLIERLAELLEIAPDEIDVREPFASYGLGSVHAISLSGELESWLGRRLSPTLVYDFPTIAALTEHIAAGPEATPEPDAVQHSASEPIAIIGLACRFPGAESPEAFWQLLRAGLDAISEVPAQRWPSRAFYDPNPATPGKMNTRWGGFLRQVDQFDAQFFGIAPREAERMDPQQRLLLELIWEALEDAGQPPDQLTGSSTGVFVGISSSDYSRLQFDDLASIDAYAGTGNAHSIAANRVSNLLDLRGPSVAIDTACSSSLVAVHLACQSLRAGECGLALAGGVNVILFPELTIAFSQARMMAADGRCKTFDASADGYVRSEGCGVVALKRLSTAIADGDQILALIRGSAVNQDGRSNGLTAPSGPAQAAVIRQALRSANVAPAQIGYLEAHGTGTPLGDPIEVSALQSVLLDGRAPDQPCLLGSVKTNIGHLEAAAGIAGLIKVVLALHHQEIPPHLHLRTLNPHIALDGTALAIPTTRQPWPAGGEPRRAGVSSFGFGGTNAHVILEEAPAPRPQLGPTRPPPYLLALSARSAAALHELAGRYEALLADADDAALRAICYSADRRSHHDYRLALVAATGAACAEDLAAFRQGETRAGMAAGRALPGRRSRLAFVFAGQGPQWWAMGRTLLAQEPVFRAMIEECDQLLGEYADWSLLAELLADEERSRLAETMIAQPALFAVQVALVALLRRWGVVPDAVVGHSVGELAAAHVAGVLGLADALRVSFQRGLVMQRATGQGQMALVELSSEQAQHALAGYEDRLSIAAINSLTTTVLSGETAALATLLEQLSQQGVFYRLLPVHYAFHSAQMVPLQDDLMAAIAHIDVRPATLPIISTLTGQAATDHDFDVAYWSRQMRQPVRFAAAINVLIEAGYEQFVEIGPHPALTKAIAQCLQQHGRAGVVLPSLRRGEAERATLLGTLGALYTTGYPLDWSRLYPAGGPPARLPAYPWQRERYWLTPTDGGERSWWTRDGGQRHPLLGRPVQLAHANVLVWEQSLDLRRLPYLMDHRFQGAEVLPGTAYLELALAAAAATFGDGPRTLNDITFRSALFLPENGARTLQLVLTRADDPPAFQIFSRPSGATHADEQWTLHASGRIDDAAEASAPQQADLAAIQARCGDEIAAADYYEELNARGLQYGPRFQGITRLWRHAGEALGQVRVPPALEHEIDAYQFHPAILDACAQVLAATDGGSERAFLPVGVAAVRFYGRPSLQIWSHAKLRPDAEQTAQGLVGDVWLYDADGLVLVEARGLRMQYLDSDIPRAIPAQLDEWLYLLRWEPRSSAAPAAPTETGTWLILSDVAGVGAALAAHLAEAGNRCVLVFPGAAYEQIADERFQIRPARLEDARRLFAAALAAGQPPMRGVVHLWSLDDRPPAETTIASLEAAQVLGSGAVVSLVQELARLGRRESARLWLVTRGAVAVGDEAALALTQAGLWGLGRTIAQEQPTLWGGLLDLDPGTRDDDGALLAAALRRPDGENQIAFRNGAALVARLVRQRANAGPAPAPRWRADGSYLITGGLGGLGLQVARWMVEQGARRVILLGRTQFPPRAEWSQIDPSSRMAGQIAAIRQLETLGASVHLAAADVSDAAQLGAFLETFRREAWPPICGVVHAAGVLQDQILLQLEAAALAEVFRAKVVGGWLLHQMLADAELDFFVLFSSAAALLGSAGQGNYAAANAFLDALAHHRRALGQPALSINWGPWAEVGMASRANRGGRLALQGIGSIPPEQGLALFGRLLGQSLIQVGVMPIDWAQLFQYYSEFRASPLLAHLAREVGGTTPAAHTNGRAGATRDTILAAAPGERRPLLENVLREQVARVIGLSPARVDVQQPLNTLGIDSLMGIELKNRIEAELGVVVPIVRLLEGPTIVEFAALLLDQLNALTPAALPVAVTADRPPAHVIAPRLQIADIQTTGTRPPFFCIHPGALDVYCYTDLARYLGGDQPFYALQPAELDNYRNIDGESAPAIRIEDVAARCIQALRELQPHGPYVLGGWSMGGVVAFEIARQLQQHGQPVALLALFDSPAPPSGDERTDYDDAELMPVFASYLGARRGAKLPLSHADFADLDLDARLSLVLEQAKQASVLPPDTRLAQLRFLFQTYKNGLRNATHQLWSYTPQLYPEVITYFRASDALEAFDEVFPDALVGWNAFTAEPLAIYDVLGDHYTLFLDPNVQVLAEQLSRCLDAVHVERESS